MGVSTQHQKYRQGREEILVAVVVGLEAPHRPTSTPGRPSPTNKAPRPRHHWLIADILLLDRRLVEDSIARNLSSLHRLLLQHHQMSQCRATQRVYIQIA